MLEWLTRRRTTERIANALYGAIVTEARRPIYYLDGGVPDTPEGRFEMIAIIQVLVLIRLGVEGARGQTLGQALNETFVRDMDDSVREMGIGDTGVARRVKKAAGALYDRHGAYARALATDDPAALPAALAAHIWAGGGNGDAEAAFIAGEMRRISHALAGQKADDLFTGSVRFAELG